jgi:DNA replication and repair protein RecF
VYVAELSLTGFRSYRQARVGFDRGLNVIVGQNATGKTNLLEGAYYALRGVSPRTRREDKLVCWNAAAARAVAVVRDGDDHERKLEVAYAPGQGKRVRADGVELSSVEELRGVNPVFIFVPESLLLVKGSPARRRAHIDAFGASCEPAYGAAHNEFQHALRQRNAQLARLRVGGDAAALDPWDAQFAAAAVALGRRRRDFVARLAAPFATTAAALAPDDGRYELRLVSQLAETSFEEPAFLAALRARRAREILRGLSSFGPQRDDLLFLEVAAGPSPSESGRGAAGASRGVNQAPADRDLRLFGSQGEQRAAVLALLLAEQAVATELTGERGVLFLDDVMSELDDERRRLLVAELVKAGQALVTTTNRHYFTDAELAGATVVELPLDQPTPQASPASPADSGPPTSPADPGPPTSPAAHDA